MRSPEGYEKIEIKKHLDNIDAWHFSPYMAGFGKSGVPDIVACYRGKFIGIEVKREGKLLTKLQLHCLEAVKTAGGWALWGTAEKVIAEIERLRHGQ